MFKRKDRKIKRVLAVLLVLAMIAGNMSSMRLVNAEAGPADGQVEDVGGTNSTGVGATYDIAVSKTIQEVEGKENYFDITLQTKTHRHQIDMSTDVIIVMDISNTMNADPVAGTGTKLDQTKAATNQFIKQFSEDTKISEDRRVGVVTFNQNAQVVVKLQEANDTNDYLTNFEQQVNAITAPKTPDEIKFTNIEGGLKLANNILAKSDAKFKFVILLTDGFPTTYIESGGTSDTKIYGYDTYMSHTSDYSTYKNSYIGKKADGTLKKPGYMVNVDLKKVCHYGVDYSDYGAQRAQSVAEEMKDSGLNIFSVGIDIGGMSIANYLAVHKGKTFSTVDTNGMGSSYVIGESSESYTTWLRDSIAGGEILADNADIRYASGDSETQLATAYSNILDIIEIAPETTTRKFYTLDPMSEVADFIGFYDKNGNLSATPDKLVGESKLNAENTAVFGGEENDNQIDWDMMSSGYTMDGENLVFTLKYRVRLMNEVSGFDWENAYDMNGTTTLYYSQKYTESGEDVSDGTGKMEYPIPETEGYKGTLKFKKIDGETNEALKGVEFTLRHQGLSCSVCAGDAEIADVKKTTDENGYIEFDNIPSGHDYTLIEKEPDKYVPVHNHTVIVSYGETYIGTKAAENKLVDGVFTAKSEEFIVKNTKVEPVEIQLQAVKSMDKKTPEAEKFEFLMSGNDVDGAAHQEIAKNDADGNVIFDSIAYDEEGTYEYTISEVTGTNSDIVYDSTQHTVKIVVTKTSDGKAYQAVVTVNNETLGTYVGEDNKIETVNVGKFSNTSRGDGEAVLNAKKIYTDGTLEEGAFKFTVTALTEGAPMPKEQTVANAADGSVSFGTIKYGTAGTYEYKISEVLGTDKSIVYDRKEYKAVVTVTAPENLTSNSEFATSVKYYDMSTGDEVKEVTFTNVDRKLPVITMEGLKTMNGKVPADGDFTFIFQRVDNDGYSIGDAVEIENDENGVINFNDALENVVQDLVAEINDPDNTTGVATARNFKIYEKAGAEENVEYDDTYYELQIGAFAAEGSEFYSLTAIMQKVDGTKVESIFRIEASHNIQVVNANNDPLVTFGNTSKVELNLTATKKLESADTTLKAGDYTFVLEDVKGTQIKATNDEAGNVKFDTIEFTAADVGTHSFVVYEVEGDNKGLFYDETRYTVTVEVAIDEYGNLSINEPEIIDEYDEKVTNMEFVNKDVVPTHLHLYARKTVNGSMPTVAQKFEFQLINADTNEVIETLHNVHETVAFTRIELDKRGTYNYIIKEVLPTTDEDTSKDGIQKDGFTYDETEYKIQVEITDAGDGNLKKKVTVNGKEDPAEHNTVTVGTFNNTYETEPASVVLGGNKELTGRELKAGEFSFVIEAVTKDAPVPVHDSKEQNAANGNFTFEKITFDKAGVYEYVVKEVIPQDAVNNVKDGVTYDTTIYNVVIEVTDNGKGELVASTKVNGNEATDIVFKNEYHTQSTAVSMTADKSLSGRTLQNGEFSFKLVEVDSENKEIKGTEQIVTNGTTSSDNVGKIYFDSIRYDEPGTHTYKISEVIPADSEKLGGVTYDEVVYTVTVKVTDNGKGQLIAKVDGKETNTYDAGEFKNKYEAEDVKVNPEVTKNFTGRDWNEKDQFTFVLEPAGDDTKEAVRKGIVKFADKKVTINADDADKKAQFGDITFTEVGTYYFTISEDSGSLTNVTYDDHVAVFRVIVTDNHKGELVADTYYRDTTTFTNHYVPDPIMVKFEGTKTLEGRDLKAGEFEFVLKDADDNVIDTVKNDANGKFEFSEISYNKEGVYSYKISEVYPESKMSGVTYDDTIYDVTVDVAYNFATGKFEKTVTYKVEDEVKDAIVFANGYDSEDVKVDITIQKKIEVSDGNTFTMKAGDFEFGITPASSNPAGDPIKHTFVYNDADGKAELAGVTYTKPGTYVYTVNEIDTEIPGVDYDDSVYKVTVVVTDDESTAKLSAAVTIEKGNNTVDGITFTNTYDPDDTTATIHGHKVLESDHKKLEAGEFQFKLEAVTEGAPMPLDDDGNIISTASNTEAGVYQFKHILYKSAGKYTYTIKEVLPEDAMDQDEATPGIQYMGYTYSEKSYIIDVTVTDNNGVLNAHVKNHMVQYGEDELANLFINGYTPEQATISLSGDKNLTGRKLNAGEFEFQLRAETQTTPMPSNAENGVLTVSNSVSNEEAEDFKEISFGEITYDKAGTYKYTVSEVKGQLSGITYDDSVYDVTVVVTDVNGNLIADTTISKNGESVNAISFNNDYTTKPVKVELDGTKTLVGRDLKAGEFEFKLTPITEGAPMPLDGEGNVVSTTTNTVAGKIEFAAIEYSQAGTYKYTVSEVIPETTLGGVDYDDSEYTVIVEVTDNGQAQLIADTKVEKDAEQVEGIVFANKYETKPVDITFQIDKDFQVPSERGWLDDDVFNFKLNAVLGTEENNAVTMEKTTVSISGTDEEKTADFGKITITEPGTYRFTITEEAGNISGVNYDEEIYRVRVDVQDDGNGNLEITRTRVNTENVDITEDGILSVGTFENTFESEAVTAVLKGTKYLEGRKLKAEEFEFGIKAINDGEPLPAKLVATNDADGNIVFDGIEFTKPGEYKYFIYEKDGDISGIQYDEEDITATVKVGYNEEGILVVDEISYDISDENGFAFYNKYIASDTSVELSATKELSGRDWLDTDEFTFTLTPAEDTKEAVDNQTVVLEKEEIKITNASKNKTESFGSIQFTKAGTYNFVIKETKGDIADVTYDNREVLVSVKVTDNGNGNLEKEVTMTVDGEAVENITFTNVYSEPENPAVKIEKEQQKNNDQVTKELLSVEPGDKVTYYLTITSTGNVSAEDVVVKDVIPQEPKPLTLVDNTISDDGKLGEDGKTITWNLGDMEPGEEKTVSFTVTVPEVEEKTTWVNMGTVQYSNNPENDPETPDEPKEIPSNEVEIEPEPEPENPVVEIEKEQQVNDCERTKELRKVDANDYVTYYVKVTNVSDAKATNVVVTDNVPEGLTLVEGSISDNGTVDKNGLITWELGTLGAGESKEVSFTVIVPEVEKETVWKNIAAVVHDDKPEKPSNEVEIKEDIPTPTAIIIPGWKVLDGKCLELGEFEFELTPITEGAPMPPLTNKTTNSSTGYFHFGPIVYTEPDVYEYEVREVNGGEDGYTYDDTVYKVVVTVTDILDNGTYNAVVNVVGATGIIFHNEYDPEDVTVDIDGIKTLEGRDLTAGEFEFELLEDGEVVGTATNKADGTFTFDSITYDEAGTYKYTVVEKNTGADGITYDETVYEIIVEVTDKGGYLVADVTVLKDGEAADLAFDNVYTPDEPDEPDTPDEPDEPDTPDELDEPDTPDEPSEPDTPDEPEESEPVAPETGDQNDLGLWITLLGVAVVGIVGTFAYRRKQR